MAASRPRPHVRVIIGRNITLAGAAVYAFTRAATYATISPSELSPTQAVITAEGHLLGAWAAVWGAAVVLCIADIVNRHTRHGLSLVVGAACAHGIAYAWAWALGGFTGTEWVVAVNWLAPAAMVGGYLLKVTALQDMLNPAATRKEGT